MFNSERPNDNLVTSNIEHEAVIASAEWVSSNGFHTKYAKSDKNGLVTKDEFLGQVDNDTKVASLMWVIMKQVLFNLLRILLEK